MLNEHTVYGIEMIVVTLEMNLTISSKVENALTSVTQQFHLFTLEKFLHMCIRTHV